MLDGEKLGKEIWAALSVNKNDQEEPVQDPTEEHWKSVGKAIVTHFKANAIVPQGIAVTTSGGNGATSGPGRIQ